MRHALLGLVLLAAVHIDGDVLCKEKKESAHERPHTVQQPAADTPPLKPHTCLMLSLSDTSLSGFSTRLSEMLKLKSLRTVPSGRMPLRHGMQWACQRANAQLSADARSIRRWQRERSGGKRT